MTKMLPLALVFLLAQSAFAAPSVGVSFYNINDVASVPDNGRLVSSSITDRTLEYIDGGDTPLYAQILTVSINDLANIPNPSGQAAALTQVITAVAELGYGNPGDSCEAAALINAYAYAASTGNSGGLRPALVNYFQRFFSYMDTIVALVVNPNSLRFSSGPRGNCLGGGRSYQFEEAWDSILANSNAFTAGLFNEEYCATKRLYTATSTRSNNLAAGITAATVTQVNEVAVKALGPLATFVRTVADGRNPTQAAAVAKTALLEALGTVKC